MATIEVIKYFKEYLSGIAYPFKPASIHPKYSQSVYTLIPIFFFLLMCFASNYAVIGNDKFVEQLMDRAVSRLKTQEQRMTAKSVRDNTESVLKSPGVRTLICVIAMLLSSCSFFLILSLFGVVLVFLVEDHNFLKQYIRDAFSATIILSIGFGVNTVLKYLYVDHRITMSSAMILDFTNDQDPIGFLLKRLDFFSLYYLTILSIRISRAFKQNSMVISTISVACLIILTLASYLIGFPFILMQ